MSPAQRALLQAQRRLQKMKRDGASQGEVREHLKTMGSLHIDVKIEQSQARRAANLEK